MPSRGSSRRSWAIVIVGSFCIALVLIAGLWGYAYWANSVPPFRPSLPPMPFPNGYTRALAALKQLPMEPSPQGALSRWPSGPPDQLRKGIMPARPTLNKVRATFRLKWRAPPPEEVVGSPLESAVESSVGFARFRSCTRYFAAESNLARGECDYDAAIQRRLDAMELGSKIPRGGTFIAGLVGVACHAIGFAGVERLVPQLPAAAIPNALERVRHIRRSWPAYPEILEIERLGALARWTKIARSDQQPTPFHMVRYLWEEARDTPSRGLAETREDIVLWLAPKRQSLQNIDRYFHQTIAEYKKPLLRRKVVAIPDDAVCHYSLFEPETAAGGAAAWWRPGLDLSLLETALAVRMHRLQHGRYPDRLSEISRRWLPAVPNDPWGQPVVYRLKDGKPLIYSIGPDGKDDGGRPASTLSLSAATRGDLVFGLLMARRK